MASFNAFGTDCTRCIEIAIPAQAETLTAFPALIGTPDAAHEFWTTVQADGSDLYFFDAAGVELPYELVAIDTGATTMECYVRVTCSNAATTYVYMLWSGSANAGNTPTDTWSGSYHLVYHGQQGASDWTDSTANGYTGTNTGVAAGVGKIGVCGDWEITGGTDYIANATAMNFEYTQAFTYMCWAQRESVGVASTIFSRQLSSGNFTGITAYWGSGNVINFMLRNDNSPNVTAHISKADSNVTMRHLAFTSTGSGTTAGMLIYIDGADFGAASTMDTLAGNTVANAAPFNVGARNSTDIGFDGLIDEVRIATVARSANWVAAEYANTNDASTWSTQTTVPNIISILPVSGTTAGGTTVTITCTGGLAAQGDGTVTFDGTAAGYTSWGWTSIVVTTPAHAAGAVDIVLENADEHTDTLAGAFTYTGGGVTFGIFSISPRSGRAGDTMTITGIGFGVAQGSVTIGGKLPPSYISWADTQAIVKVPAGTGVVDVVLTTA